MNTEQNYVGRASHATTSTSGHQYRTKIYLLVAKTAQQTGLAESVIWQNMYSWLSSHYDVYLAALPRHHKESLLRVAERHDLLDKVYLCALAEQTLLLGL